MRRGLTLSALGLALLPGAASSQVVDPTVVTEAGRSFLDVGVVGALCIMLMVALRWVMVQWMAAITKMEALAEKRLEDRIAIAEAAEAMRVATVANTAVLQSLQALLQDRGRP